LIASYNLHLELTSCRCRREPPRSHKEGSKEAARRNHHPVAHVVACLLPPLRAGPTCPRTHPRTLGLAIESRLPRQGH